ncbi:MAG TPA: NUDIX hydrolase, partial [Opitutales bacterium]|nr:NUDIX hydrolase [Opitutales bacterium]
MTPPERWETVNEKLLQPCHIFDLFKRRCKHPKNNKEGDFYLLKTNDWVQCLALTPDDRLIVVQQYRFGVDDLCWEFAGGIIHPGEDPAHTALRELEEETGYKGERAIYLNGCYTEPAILNNQCHFILIEGCVPNGTLNWDENEEIAVAALKWDEVL